jgi:hypothetical protein
VEDAFDAFKFIGQESELLGGIYSCFHVSIEVANLSKVDEDVMYKAYTLCFFIYELLTIKSIDYSNLNPFNTDFIHNLTSNFGDFHIFSAGG